MGVDRLARAQCVAAFFLAALGCGGSNEPSVASGNTAAAGSGMSATNSGKPDTGSPAGSSSMSSDKAGSSPGAAGKSSSSGGGTGGSMTSSNSGGSSGKSSSSGGTGGSGTGGAGSGTGGAGSGSSTSGTGGSMTSSGGGGSGGSPDATNAMFSPLCDAVPPTAAGAAPTKGGACTESDTQLCYKTCGPQSIGFKSETCTNGAYAEMTGCSFPDADYSCFKIPATQDASCPTMTPQSGKPCEVAACTLCAVDGMYLDSMGTGKVGYCVCPMAGASGMRKWSCATNTAWPCPTGRGC